MAKKERIQIPFVIPKFQIGSKIWVPQKNTAVIATILYYDAVIGPDFEKNKNAGSDKDTKENGLVAIVARYQISNFVSVRSGENAYITTVICGRDFCADETSAQKASRFLPVKADKEAWKRAVGVRGVAGEDSPYNITNCNLQECCANISEARDLLTYCRHMGGLIVQERDELVSLLEGHGFTSPQQTPLGDILRQLEITQ